MEQGIFAEILKLSASCYILKYILGSNVASIIQYPSQPAYVAPQTTTPQIIENSALSQEFSETALPEFPKATSKDVTVEAPQPVISPVKFAVEPSKVIEPPTKGVVPPKMVSLYPPVTVPIPAPKLALKSNHIKHKTASNGDDESPPAWPTPPIRKKIRNPTRNMNGDSESSWPTPALHYMHNVRATQKYRKPLVDYSADRRTITEKNDSKYKITRNYHDLLKTVVETVYLYVILVPRASYLHTRTGRYLKAKASWGRGCFYVSSDSISYKLHQ